MGRSVISQFTTVMRVGYTEGVILLATLNSTYQHSSFGLRYLRANLGALRERSQIREFTIVQRPRDIAEAILSHRPSILGLGVYIWNARESLELVSLLKRVAPELVIVLGGPEVSYESQEQEICRLADYTIQGEGDFAFRELCESLLGGKRPDSRIFRASLPAIDALELPYEEYTDSDIANRVIYVEASRGCPYKCEYCLSSLDLSVRNVPLENFLLQMDRLIERGARQFKFVDRTFNLRTDISSRILDFFLERVAKGLFLHFEMVPDRLPEELKSQIERFPPGALQFEIGIQTWSPQVAALVSRRQDFSKVKENLQYLRERTHVHTHVDLIAGLPGEDLKTFALGFDAVSALDADEIQVGVLKRLRGTPIVRHTQEWGMVYQDQAPYVILANKLMSFNDLQKLQRFARFWDLYANSGNFVSFIRLIRNESDKRGSFFWEFWLFCDFLRERHGEAYAISLLNLLESAWVYGTRELKIDTAIVRQTLVADYTRQKSRDIPPFLRDSIVIRVPKSPRVSSLGAPARQMRHLGAKERELKV